MLATLGDLVEDVVVRLGGPLQWASDTSAVISRRRGGSAANVAACAASLGAPVRFIGQVGDDRVGRGLVAELAAAGVDVSLVSRRGSSGTVIVVVDEAGERTMLTDRRTCVDLAPARAAWLEGVTTLHVPFYSFAVQPLGDTARTLAELCADRGVDLSIDLSSTAVICDFGVEETSGFVTSLDPAVVFANAEEAELVGLDRALGGAITVIKRGDEPATVHRPGLESIDVPAIRLDRVVDTTGAGDAFAAGFLCHDRTGDGWRADPVGACRAGHRAAIGVMNARL